MNTADCVPILLWDGVRGAVAAVHAGWRGTAKGIAARCVELMMREYDSDPAALQVAIGPCIGPCCFETGPEVPDAMLASLGPEAERFITACKDAHGASAAAPRCDAARSEESVSPSKFLLDLKQLNAIWLRRAGVEQIDISCDCTRCQPDRFWSHRFAGQERGSQAAIIMLNE